MDAKHWITAPVDMGDVSCEFRKKFVVDKKVVSAHLAVSAMGLYAAYINGKRIGRAVLTPGLTSYKKRIQYQVFDVTEMIKKNNEINIVGAPGWAVGEFAWEERVRNFADYYSVIGELTIRFADGTKTVVATNTSWDVYSSITEFSSIYHGETVNLTHKSRLIGKAKKSDVKSALVEQVGEYITEQQKVAPAELIVTPKGERVIDFGQNMTGYVEFRIKGKKGERIRITHAEVLDKDGNFYNDNYRHARNEMIYVLDGKEDVFKPRFSFQGFRYIRIEEYPAQEMDLSSITAIVVYSEIKRTGYFKCGNEKIKQLYSNAVWGQRGNYLDIPTDCPQRDERMGWTGDAQIFCRTGSFNFDTDNRSTLENLLGFIGIILFNPFEWEAKCNFQIEIPIEKPEENEVFGDFDGSGEVEVADAYFARLVAAKLVVPTEEQLAFCDVDSDGKITAIDANLIRKYAVGIIKELPVK
jgi:alpha-L-rhamnosidase